MKREPIAIVLTAALLVIGVGVLTTFAGPPYSHTVGTNSVMILPPRTIQNATAWATNTLYSQGAIVSYNGMFFWCQTAANATNTASDIPAWEADGRSADGANTWQFIPSGKRNSFAIVNDGANACYLSFGSAAVVNSGIRINSSGGNVSDFSGGYQGAVYAISGASNGVTAQEW